MTTRLVWFPAKKRGLERGQLQNNCSLSVAQNQGDFMQSVIRVEMSTKLAGRLRSFYFTNTINLKFLLPDRCALNNFSYVLQENYHLGKTLAVLGANERGFIEKLNVDCRICRINMFLELTSPCCLMPHLKVEILTECTDLSFWQIQCMETRFQRHSIPRTPHVMQVLPFFCSVSIDLEKLFTLYVVLSKIPGHAKSIPVWSSLRPCLHGTGYIWDRST